MAVVYLPQSAQTSSACLNSSVPRTCQLFITLFREVVNSWHEQLDLTEMFKKIIAKCFVSIEGPSQWAFGALICSATQHSNVIIHWIIICTTLQPGYVHITLLCHRHSPSYPSYPLAAFDIENFIKHFSPFQPASFHRERRDICPDHVVLILSSMFETAYPNSANFNVYELMLILQHCYSSAEARLCKVQFIPRRSGAGM